MTISHRITLIARDREIASHVAIRLQSKGYQVVTLIDLASIMGLIYTDPPDVIIADLSSRDSGYLP